MKRLNCFTIHYINTPFLNNKELEKIVKTDLINNLGKPCDLSL